uniref:Protein FAR1-RELATED SEQUENCE n=1 Tax=Rhabditophanes sp. KR3021 TaxID=114890 RepID=A0AC35U869_9BILA
MPRDIPLNSIFLELRNSITGIQLSKMGERVENEEYVNEEFIEYFNTNYIMSRAFWYLGAVRNSDESNNGVESLNSVMKSRNNRQREPLKAYVNSLKDFLHLKTTSQIESPIKSAALLVLQKNAFCFLRETAKPNPHFFAVKNDILHIYFFNRRAMTNEVFDTQWNLFKNNGFDTRKKVKDLFKSCCYGSYKSTI